MLGRIRKKQMNELHQQCDSKETKPIICPICEREIPLEQRDAHHLVPRSKGGKATEYLHRICHRQIHALFTETELAVQFNTAEAIRQHPQIQKFTQWVQTKPNAFYERVAKSTRLRER
jgi:hypothetical protein